ncbi:MAG: sensor histidine kinase [Alphaproteobacteria bacterium]|nr:sensor histidine kinase [Alphaproteobacteria bacterium]
MENGQSQSARGRFADLPLAAASIGGFWFFYFATILIRVGLLDPEASLDDIGRRALGCGFGVLVTFIVWVVVSRAAREKSLRIQVIAAALACLPASAIFATFNLAFTVYQPLSGQPLTVDKGPNGLLLQRLPNGEYRLQSRGHASVVVAQMPSFRETSIHLAPRIIAEGIVTWYFFFAAWSSFYLAMSSARQLRASERREAKARREAQTAQLRALRYQVNPHFLFNTLNSLSSLVMGRRPDEAETMIVNLSTFFRTSLSIDPTEDINLAQEIEFQQLYLDIEQVRFPNRLRVRIEVPDDLWAAKVPPLILQPVVENAIKHGVARTSEPVTLTIAAREEDAKLILSVENDQGPAIPREHEGGRAGVGLINVCERLAARFGPEGECEHGPLPGGGYRVTLTMPLDTDD